jgi:hypothetical protein
MVMGIVTNPNVLQNVIRTKAGRLLLSSSLFQFYEKEVQDSAAQLALHFNGPPTALSLSPNKILLQQTLLAIHNGLFLS